MLGFFVIEMNFSQSVSQSVTKSAKLLESVTEKRDSKKHLSLSVAI